MKMKHVRIGEKVHGASAIIFQADERAYVVEAWPGTMR